MRDRIVKIKGNNPFVRDRSNMAIINSDGEALKKAKAQKEQRKKEKQRIDNLEQKFDELKDMMKLILDKLDK